jgi:hypothetical protein
MVKKESEEAEKKQEERKKALQLNIKDKIAMFIALLETVFLPLIILLIILISVAVLIMLFLRPSV